MREKGQTEVAKTLETPVFSRGIEILTEKSKFIYIIICEVKNINNFASGKCLADSGENHAIVQNTCIPV